MEMNTDSAARTLLREVVAQWPDVAGVSFRVEWDATSHAFTVAVRRADLTQLLVFPLEMVYRSRVERDENATLEIANVIRGHREHWLRAAA